MAGSKPSSNKSVGSEKESCPLKKGSIVVQVLRMDTGDFIRGTKVKLDGPSSGNQDCDPKTGSATFDPVDPGKYKAEAVLPAEEQEKFQPSPFGYAAVRAGGCGVITILLQPLAKLKVKVFASNPNSSRVPELVLANASVKVVGVGKTMNEMTSRGGIADIGSLEEGSYDITVELAETDRKKYAPPRPQRVTLNSGDDRLVPIKVSPVELCWIAINVLEEDGEFTKGELPYWIQLPDGRVREGTFTDGHLHLEDIPCGNCIVKLPGISSEDFVVPGNTDVQYEEPKNDFFEVLVEEKDHTPLAEAAYWLRLPDGTEKEGKLDKYGMLRIEGVAAGNCEFKLVDYDKDDLVLVREPAATQA